MSLQAKAVYLELERAAMWQSFILKLGVLWLVCQLLIYHGSCSHDMKRQLFEEGSNILQYSPMQQDQDIFCYRKANLNKCIRSTLRSKDQDFGRLLQEDAHGYLQLSDMPSRSALLSAPARGLLNILDSYLHGSTSSSNRILASQQHPLYDSHLEPSASIDASQSPYTYMHTLVKSNPLLPPMQDIQHQDRLYANMAMTALPPNQPPVEFVSPSFPSSYSQFPHVPSQSLRLSERAYSDKLTPSLAPYSSPVAPFHNIQSPKLSPQSFDVPRKQLPQALPPLNGQSSVVDKPSLPSNQVPSVTVPTTHSHQHHRHHSKQHPALPNPPNAFPKHYPPDQFNGSFPALPPEARPKSFAIPAVSAHSPSSSVPRSARRRRSPRHAPIVLPPRDGGRIATSPTSAASEHHRKKPRIPVAASPLIFPSPPPSQDCTTMTCGEPLTYSPPNAPCGCVLPMQIGILLEVAPYAFFPLVSELAAEIAAGTYLKQSQIRIMGATAYSQDQEKTFVSIDLVPLGEKFDNMTAFLTYERFWQKKVIINGTLFGDYQVVSVQYPGLPSLPPSQYSNATVYSGPNGSNSGSNSEQPLGVDVRRKNERMGGGIIAVVTLSSAVAVVICLAAVWFMLLKCSHQIKPSPALAPTFVSSATKRSGAGSILSSSRPSSTSFSFVSSMATYTGSARTFTPAELEKATDRFSSRNILGEGGFGRVYRGVLEDGTKLAVKVLTRDDHQGGREFIAEVEMLSRLHHRNLVKLIGICTEEHNRCLVYELIPNGSVESHLHGPDKETAPLDWDTRMKIALGAARGLAYLHEDSNPRVIHRDFKASNILLEDDFTPKVSDFGLAKAATDEGKEYISTRVMGTFGYVAPEYAMTGHLLVKSDVYSYGVVLLELLSGRKPVDMSQPHGQENLVTWARPLLTTKEGLEMLVDPSLKGSFSFDNMARVAAIASMCVQIESSHRPFMGEVVQALKLVYNDSDASNRGGSRNSSRGEESLSTENELKQESERTWWPSMQYTPDGTSFVTIDYDSGPLQAQGLDTERPLSASALLSSSGNFISKSSESFRRYSCSGPLRPLRSKPSWYRIRGLTGGSMSEHGLTRHFRTGLDTDDHELWP